MARGKGSKGSSGKEGGGSSKKKPCPGNPCEGKKPAAEARGWQGQKPGKSYNYYDGVDAYENVVIKKGTTLYALDPGGMTGFAVTIAAVRQAKGDAQKYHDLVQVTPGWDWKKNQLRDMRSGLRGYIVQKDICVAKGKAKANTNFIFKDNDGNIVGKDPRTYSGGGTQFYVHEADRSALKLGKLRKI